MGETKLKKEEGTKVSKGQVFSLSGPVHLTTIDWSNPYHRKSVAASLVQGVYILERDRQQNRLEHEAQAHQWWDFFSFQLNHVLIDEADKSIFGAIYEFKPYASYHYHPLPKPPAYVIAFRGTISKRDSISRDLKLDLRCINNSLHQSSRFQLAMQSLQNMVSVIGAGNIWLTGHSLGSSMAMLAGKKMAKMGYPIETYLFNPPFISLPIERIKNEKVKNGIRFTSSLVKAGLSLAVKGTLRSPYNDYEFSALSSWVPNLFVNPGDHICAEYIGYFQHRKSMHEMGATNIARVATQSSVGSLVSSAFGKETEPLDQLPSAYLTINLVKSSDFKRAHGIHQWWNPNFVSQSELHMFR